VEDEMPEFPPPTLSQLIIDTDKDWNAKKISNLSEISVGDIVFANGWRFTEVENGIALVDERGNIIRRWVHA
jgi:hypothetical protein